MDIVIDYADRYVLNDYVYPNTWSPHCSYRQALSLLLIVNIGGYAVYLIPCTLSYLFLFDKRLLQHPKILKDQVRKEISYSCRSIPLMSIPTSLMFFLEIKGYSKLYTNVDDNPFGWYGIIGSAVTFILFTDCFIYWIHRLLHYKWLYKHIHKDHHQWKVPTPFASHAFHPVDGFMQSWPYHIYPFLFPLHKFTYLLLFIFVNLWTISIHDGDYRVPMYLRPIINGSAHHTDHHIYYNYNYGQFFTLWDKIGGSFKSPSAWDGDSLLAQVLQFSTDGSKNEKGPRPEKNE